LRGKKTGEGRRIHFGNFFLHSFLGTAKAASGGKKGEGKKGKKKETHLRAHEQPIVNDRVRIDIGRCSRRRGRKEKKEKVGKKGSEGIVKLALLFSGNERAREEEGREKKGRKGSVR